MNGGDKDRPEAGGVVPCGWRPEGKALAWAFGPQTMLPQVKAALGDMT